ncbi:MAG: C-5 cytosine-specific DNA methylase [Alteromonadaceae bacterium]|uniref:DNA cytosine methyltransferase n=1 Tax=uncultured Paraglaciecola sp. TaxID=1765024 RepID=UPI000C4CB22A|nr:C-5 cytosine-specific DNA methylase [Alteromonadaceae bacterium]|tara:strand:+ start:28272 stop:29684 length:1413 start_codon:yes stop_codon:yes gene_type:complete
MSDFITLACTPHKNAKRTFIEGQILARNGFVKGVTYTRTTTPQGIVLELDGTGPLKVVGKAVRGCQHKKPVIDVCNKDFAEFTGDAEQVQIHAEYGRVTIKVHTSEKRKAEREASFEKACNVGTLTEGTLCVGIGMSTLALHHGFKNAGYGIKTKWVADRARKYLDVAIRNNPAVTKDTKIINSALEMVELDEYSSVNICQFSLSCRGHSKSGKAKNKITLAEQHSKDAAGAYGLMKALDRINAAVYVSENVPEAQDSATYTLIKATLQALGYNVYEANLDSEQSGSIEERPRYWFVAISKGLAFNAESTIPSFPRPYAKLSEIMEPIAHDDGMWSDNTYLKEKAIRDAASGKGFKRQLVTGETESIGVINRLYAKRQSTPPMIVREDEMERLLTPKEHALAKQCDPMLVADTTFTTSHEGLGQGIDMKQGEGIAQFIGEAICNLVKRPRKQAQAQLNMYDLLFGDCLAA